MLLKDQKLTFEEMNAIEGGAKEVDKTYDGGTLDEIIVTPQK